MVKEEQSWNIKPFQSEVLKIFRQFETMCERHGWRYFTYGGTTLGALRHKGFIPWDDDFDIEMPREDYNDFVKCVRDELPRNLEFRRGGIDGPVYFSKIVSVEPGIVERMNRETNLSIPSAPFIDVFVLDGVPDDVRNIRRWWFLRRLWRLAQIYRYPESSVAYRNRTGISGIVKMAGTRFLGFWASLLYPRTRNNDEMMALLDALALRWPYAKCISVVEPMFFRMRTLKLAPKWFYEPARIVPFEGGTIRIPAHAEDLCTIEYGDYMTPPPPEFQVPEHCMGISWNDERERASSSEH